MALDESIYAAVAQLLKARTRWPRLLALGEPFHGEETFPRLRNDLLRGLVDHEGCRCVALESDCLAGRLVDRHVLLGDGDLDRVMTDGFSHGFGAAPGNRAMVEWLGEHNGTCPPADRVRFAGVDAPMEHSGARSPREPLRMLHTFLAANCEPVPHRWSRIDALIGDEDRWTNPEVIMDPSKAVGDSSEAHELRVITDDLGWLLTSLRPQVAGGCSPEALREAELGARTAAGLLAYHAVLARTDPNERLERGLGVRDAMMAANLRALATREHDNGPVLVFAQNEHLRRNPARMRIGPLEVPWVPAGAHLARTYGPQYAVIATAVGSAPHAGIDEPPADTLEGLLASTTSTPRLVSQGELTELATESPGLTTRTTGNPGYFPLSPTTLTDFDAVLFLPHVPPPAPGRTTPLTG